MSDVLDLIVSGLSAGAASASKETASALVKDSYAGIKKLISEKFGEKVSVEDLERNPSSENKRLSLKEDLAHVEADKDTALFEAVNKLISDIKSVEGNAVVAGVNLSEIEAKFLKIQNVKSGNGSAVNVNKAKISGGIDIRDIESGRSENP